MPNISVVSYLNTAPFLYGIKHSGFLDQEKFTLWLDNPATCAAKVLNGDAEIGLIPVAVLPQLKQYHIIGNTCIGADGKVDSVLLLSHVPLNRISEIYLDYQSRTSVNLCRILASRLWKIDVRFHDAPADFLEKIENDKAAVVIGDRALDRSAEFRYVYDLAEAWKELTGLPFVFAVWVSTGPFSQRFEDKFSAALEWGVQYAAEAAKKVLKDYPLHFNVEKYLTESISYTFDERKREGLETFLSLLSKSHDSES